MHSVIYVLIVVSAGYNGSVTTMHDFGSKEACMNAGKEIRDIAPEWRRPGYACVPKGGE